MNPRRRPIAKSRTPCGFCAPGLRRIRDPTLPRKMQPIVIGGIRTGFPVRGRACVCTKSGQQPVDGLHSIGNTCGCRCQFLIDSEFGRSTNRYTRSPDNSLTHFNSNPDIGLADTWCDAANEGMDWRTGRGDSARRCPPRERTAGFLTVDRGGLDRPGFKRSQAATGLVAATLLRMATLREGIAVGGRPLVASAFSRLEPETFLCVRSPLTDPAQFQHSSLHHS